MTTNKFRQGAKLWRTPPPDRLRRGINGGLLIADRWCGIVGACWLRYVARPARNLQHKRHRLRSAGTPELPGKDDQSQPHIQGFIR